MSNKIFEYIRKGDLTNVKPLVLTHGVDPTDGDGWSALELACVLQKEEIVKYLVEANANVNFKDPKGATPLHQLCFTEKNTMSLATILLEKGANPDAINENGSSPLHFAAGKGNVGNLKLLLAFGADGNLKNKNGKTPLQLAEEKGMQDCAEAIRNHMEKAKSSGGGAGQQNVAKVVELEKEVADLKAQLAEAHKKIAELEKKE